VVGRANHEKENNGQQGWRVLTLEGCALAGLGLAWGRDERAGGAWQRDGLTEEEDLCRLFTFFDELLGFL
jgi:hypothetical protein